MTAKQEVNPIMKMIIAVSLAIVLLILWLVRLSPLDRYLLVDKHVVNKLVAEFESGNLKKGDCIADYLAFDSIGYFSRTNHKQAYDTCIYADRETILLVYNSSFSALDTNCSVGIFTVHLISKAGFDRWYCSDSRLMLRYINAAMHPDLYFTGRRSDDGSKYNPRSD